MLMVYIGYLYYRCFKYIIKEVFKWNWAGLIFQKLNEVKYFLFWISFASVYEVHSLNQILNVV